jgi:hypothetical protein
MAGGYRGKDGGAAWRWWQLASSGDKAAQERCWPGGAGPLVGGGRRWRQEEGRG